MMLKFWHREPTAEAVAPLTWLAGETMSAGSMDIPSSQGQDWMWVARVLKRSE